MGKKVIVIGAGPGGLAAAMLLASQGVEVKVLEKQPRVGGRTSTIETKQGFHFDLGPTFFLYPRVLQEIFQAVGKNLMREVPMTRLDPQYRLIFESGGELQCTPDIARMEKAIAAISPCDAPNFRRFLNDNREKLAAFRPILESPFSSMRDLMTLAMMKKVPLVRPWQSLDRDLATYFHDERIRLSFCFQSKYLGMSPFKCPSLFSILSFLEYEYGVWHPTGGCGAVSKAMARILAEMGVEIALDEPVEEIIFKGRRATAVRTRNGIEEADAIVINADFARTMTSLVPNHLRRRWTDQKLAKKKFSCSTFMLYLGVDGTFPDVAHHNILLAKDYKTNLAEIERDHQLSTNPSIYVQNPCITDPTLAPKGKSAIYALVPVTHQHANVDWQKAAPHFRALAIQQMKKIGLPDLTDRILYEKILTPQDWDSTYNIHLGATFNLAHSFDQMLHLRPHNRFEDLPGIYLVGGGTHPGSGLPVIYESAKITSKLLLEDFGMSAPKIGTTTDHPQHEELAPR